jgi:hypothetical protein
MSDLLANGAAWLADHLAASSSKPVRFYRGTNYGIVNATIGRSTFESQNENGIIENWESRDFIVRTSSLPFGEPKRADYIVETIEGIDVTYEVTAPRGVPLFHYGDAFRETVRVHAIAKGESAGISPTLKRRFWGAFAGDTISGSQIAASLATDLGGSRAQSRTIAAQTAYIYVVLPTSFGVPTFAVSGLTTSAWETTQRTITFSGQTATSYGIYRSTYPITGTVNLVVA